jgi:putative membrane protein
MTVVAAVLVGLGAVLHVGFAVLEMVLWTKPAGRAVFRTDAEFAEKSAPLALNQGLYNLFLVAGLVWGLLAPSNLRTPVEVFFLACVIVAGLVGAATVSRRILFIQAAPAVLALIAVLIAA